MLHFANAAYRWDLGIAQKDPKFSSTIRSIDMCIIYGEIKEDT